jgi:hypothetical protein
VVSCWAKGLVALSAELQAQPGTERAADLVEQVLAAG